MPPSKPVRNPDAIASVPDGHPGAAGRVLLLSTTAFTLLFAVWVMLGVLGVPIQAELGLSPVKFAWLTAIAVLSGSLLRLPMGLLTDVWGGRNTMVALLLFCAVPTLATAYTHSFAGFMACAALFGVAGNSFSTGIAWNAAWFPRERQGVALGTFGAGNVGASITKLIGPVLIALVPASGLGVLPGGWRFVPVLYAAALLVMAALVWRYAPRPDPRPGAGRALGAMLAPLRFVRVWRFGLYYVVVFGAYVAFSLWLPRYYMREYDLSLGNAALLTALFIFPASLLRPLGGWLSDRYGARRVTYTVFAVILGAGAPLAFPRQLTGGSLDLLACVALIEVVGVAMGIGKASVFRFIPDYFPRDVGAVGGLVGTLGALGGFVLPIGFGYLDQATARPESCFWLLLALTGVCLGWLHVTAMRLRLRERTPVRPSPALARMRGATAPSHPTAARSRP